MKDYRNYLKTGNFVQFFNGNWGMVSNGNIILQNGEHAFLRNTSKNDIKKIVKADSFNHAKVANGKKILWENRFTVADIHNGMFVKILYSNRSATTWGIVSNRHIVGQNGGLFDLKQFDKDLKTKTGMKILTVSKGIDFESATDPENYIWER